MKLYGRMIAPGRAGGETLVTSQGISFFGGVDVETGVIVERGHELEGQCIAGKVLVFPGGNGSTVGSYTLYRLKHAGKAPAAIINAECETIIAVGCIIAEIPCVDQVSLAEIRSGQVAILYKDIITYGFREKYYLEARKRGVLFVRYTDSDRPEVRHEGNTLKVAVHEHVFGRQLEVETDFVALKVSDDQDRLVNYLPLP